MLCTLALLCIPALAANVALWLVYISFEDLTPYQSNCKRTTDVQPVASFVVVGIGLLFLTGCGRNGIYSGSSAGNVSTPGTCAPAFWRTRTVSQETVLPLHGKTAYPLWQIAATLVSVEQVNTGKVFIRGADYELDGGQLVIPAGSSIALAPAGFPYTPDPDNPNPSASLTKSGGGLRIAEDYRNWQIAVTYTAMASPAGPTAASQPLTHYLSKLASAGMPSVTIYGDSIAAGASADAGRDFVSLLAAALSGKATIRNRSGGGWGAAMALENIDTKVNDQVQDVVILAFGMNDAAGTDSAALFKQRMEGMIDAVRAKNPQTEFILVSGIRGNAEWVFMRSEMFDQYRDEMNELASAYKGVAVVDVTEIWDSIVARKTFYDLTGNGVNHPGNFGHSIYGDLMIRALTVQPEGCS